MPITLSGIKWWEWLICAGILELISFFSLGLSYKYQNGCFLALIGEITGLAAIICGLIGIVRFVRWAWAF